MARRIDLSKVATETQLSSKTSIFWLTSPALDSERRASAISGIACHRTALAYIRLSQQTGANEMNLDQQIDQSRRLAAASGCVIAGYVVEYGESAFDEQTASDRPGYIEMVRCVAEREVDDVVAFQQDRVWRQKLDLETFKVLALRTGTRIITSNAVIEPGDPGSDMMSTILGAIAQMESAIKRQRQLAKAAERALRGLPGTSGGRRPFAFEQDRITVREGEAQVLRDVVDEFLDGVPLHALVARLNHDGITTTAGNPWAMTSLRQVLRSKRYVGIREHKRIDPLTGRKESLSETEAVWPAIIPAGKFELVQALLDDPTRRTNERQRQYLLSGGLLRCGVCDHALISRPNKGKPGYRCSKERGGCGRVVINALRAEAAVEAVVREFLTDESLPQRASFAAVGAADELAKARAQLQRAQDMAADGDLDRDAFRRQQTRLQARISELQSALVRSQAPSWVSDPGALDARWDELPHGERRAVIAWLLDHARVMPASRGGRAFDPERVVVRWNEDHTLRH